MSDLTETERAFNRLEAVVPTPESTRLQVAQAYWKLVYYSGWEESKAIRDQIDPLILMRWKPSSLYKIQVLARYSETLPLCVK